MRQAPVFRPTRPLLIANDQAGPGSRRDRCARVVASFLRFFPSGSAATVPSRQSAEMAKTILAHSPDLLVLYGGDGTVNRILAHPVPPDLPILVLPGGTGNVLARFLGIPHMPARLEGLWEGISGAAIQVVRPGMADDRPFLLMAGIGWDGEAAKKVRAKKTLGLLAYYEAGLRTLACGTLLPFTVTIETPDNQVFQVENVRWCLASRLSPYFGPFSVRGGEEPDARVLTVVLATGSRLNIPRAFLSFLPGGERLVRVPRIRARSLLLVPPRKAESASPAIQIDGESLPFASRFGVSSEVLRFLRF